jgi:ferredoxin
LFFLYFIVQVVSGFGHKTGRYSSKLKIDNDKCIGCGLCAKLCPMKNITIKEHKAVSGDQCTMCYRCINKCPGQALTLLGKKVVEQCGIEKYI